MNSFMRFFYEFISQFFDGVMRIGRGIGTGLASMFNFRAYKAIITSYMDNFNWFQWILVGLAILVLIFIVAAVIVLIFFFIRKYIRLGKSKINQEDLLGEISDLNDQVAKLMKEKDELMAMKVSQLGLKPGDEDIPEEAEEVDFDDIDKSNTRFPKLTKIDKDFATYKVQKYNNTFTLEELADNIRAFSASRLKLYYDISLIRTFVAALACGKLIILQGISGTGKTSLAYMWGKFVARDACVASVQPSWRDKTEFFGYFNEFTKKFNETDPLAEIYEASYTDDVHTVILDEMNIARVEYYFAELLSVLEIPRREEWQIELVPNYWPDDPKYIDHGKLQMTGNLWYIGTINNDESTYAVTDKVYDRGMPIDINTKADPFKSRDQDPMNINASYLEALFDQACEKYPVSQETLDKLEDMDQYVMKHFRIAFGNRIVKQINIFVPVFVACGGGEIEAVDYFITRKIFRKLEQLNIMFIREEFDPFLSYINKQFGKENMPELVEYIERLKKL